MPESAECRLTTDFLNDILEGRCISKWGFVGGKYVDEQPEGFDEFEDALPLMVEEVNCKGKFIYFVFHNEEHSFYILHSLMMTGRWQKEYDEQCKWYIELDNDQTIWFRNPRSLATLKFTTDYDVLQAKLDSLGPDILTDEFTLPVWRYLVRIHSNRNITAFLMDQSVIAGCGNYIKAEALYYAGISPMRKIGSLKEHESEKLFEALRIIPRVSYNNRGLSIRDYADENGVKGNYESVLSIYGKTSAKRTKTADGRITYWDPKCQC